MRLAYIDYSFSLSYEWIGVAGPQGDPRAAFPTDVAPDTAAVAATVEAIERIPEATQERPVEGAAHLSRKRTVAGWGRT